MDLRKPTEVLTQCSQMLLGQQTVMANRTRINRLFNGEAPATEDERRAENIKTNVNFLEATRLAANAKEQLGNAFNKGDRFFTVNINHGPVALRKTVSEQVSQCINRELKKSRGYLSARKSAFAQVVLHGPGPMAWRNRRIVVPGETGVDDVLLPTGTRVSMDNLDRFAIYSEMTWGELRDQARGKVVDPGWNKGYVGALLASLYNRGVEPVYQGNRWLFPEKMAEDVKEGGAWTVSSALPKVGVFNFFYRDEDTGKWNRNMVLDYGTVADDVIKKGAAVRTRMEFIYEKDGYAEDWQEIVHFYIGNCSNVAPFRYYSIRSIGYLLYGICMLSNKLKCRMSDHTFQQLLTWFRNVSDDNREQLQMIDLQNYGVFPQGVSMVTAQERHQVDWNLPNFMMGQLKQLMAESAQGFVPEVVSEGSSGKEMTASEWIGRMNMSIALTSAVAADLAVQSGDEYREVCRRFCIKGNPDPMAVRFREKMRRYGVSEEYLDVEKWDVVPEHVTGGGNKAAELMASQAAMQELLPYADPDGQRMLLRKRALSLFDNADEAMLLFPAAPKPPGDDVQYAQAMFPVLMEGVPVVVQDGVNRVAYTAMLLQMSRVVLGQVVAAVESPQGVSMAADKIVGLFNVLQHCGEQVQMMAQAKAMEQQVKMLGQELQQQMGALQQAARKMMAMEEEQQGQGGVSPEAQAKVQEKLMMAQVQAQIHTQAAALKQEHRDTAWNAEQERKNASTAADIERQNATTAVGLRNEAVVADAKAELIRRQPVKPGGGK